MTSRILPDEAPLARALQRIKADGADADRDRILGEFLQYVSDIGLQLYPAQEEAILELLEGRHVVLNTPTGSGKSLVAQALHFQALVEGRISYYTSPIKALVNEKFFDLCKAFGPEHVGLLTGDASVNRSAPIICCTAEVLSNMALRDPSVPVDYVVMDEFHFYGDRDRGIAWHVPLITMRESVFLLMSATLGDMTEISRKLAEFTDRDVAKVVGTERPVPLTFEYKETPIQETIEQLLQANEAPIYLVNFTQRSCAEQAQALTSLKVIGREDRDAIARQLETFRFDTPYGKELQRFIRAGIGVHHAGLLPKYRLLVEKLSQMGLLKVISGTDSLGVGVNIPIRTVLFRQLCKYDGEKTRIVSAREFHQVAGRAGRKGFDDHGKVVVLAPEHIIENRRLDQKRQKSPHLKNKLVNKKPPQRGYIHWDEKTFQRLLDSLPEPLTPQFQVTHGMLIHVLQARGRVGYKWLLEVIRRAHLRDGEKRFQIRRLAMLFKALRSADIIQLEPRADGHSRSVKIREDLQSDFSLNQTLSLYLVEVLQAIEPESESRDLDMLTVVESILENPTVILIRQVDRLKDELVAKLKAEGVEYDERMAQLEKVEHPKPCAEFIYETFNSFAKSHPWVGDANVEPKSVARDIWEKCIGFSDYVNDLGVARSEGVLLRYLSQVYKTATQNVPTSYHTETFDEIIGFFHTIIKRVDSSLLDEWERMMRGEIVLPEDRYRELEPSPVPKALDLAADFKVFSRRLRHEMYLLLRSLADRRYEQASELVRQVQDDPWPAKKFEQALAAYYEEHATIDVSQRARHTDKTFIRELGPRRWEVTQKIVDPEGDEDWAVVGVVDLEAVRDDSEPLIAVERIGV